MIFSSWQFIVLFLPISVLVYFWLNGRRWILAGKAWLVLASLFFYGFWDVRYLPLILISIAVNYAIGTGLSQSFPRGGQSAGPAIHLSNRRLVLIIGIALNLLLLGYFKYTDFLIVNMNAVFGAGLELRHIVLPLAISFFTFTQIVYLVDSYRGETSAYDLLNYALFVTFFPHLIAGPIVQHSQIMPQFDSVWKLRPRSRNILRGLTVFGFGLFKKAAIADTFAIWANAGFDSGQALNFYEAWVTSLSYTFQLYFDFSGYCDMAVGASLLFNIRLPDNFNSPYKATSIQDFWRRWHITLSSFLRNYVYIPLGGNRGSEVRTYINLFVTFILGGLWHGATWMFVIWGALHGLALMVHRGWQKLGRPLPWPAAWLLTFLFVNFAWIFFRAETLGDAMRVLSGMADLKSALPIAIAAAPTSDLAWAGYLADALVGVVPAHLVGQLPILLLIGAAVIVLRQRNTIHLVEGRISAAHLIAGAVLFSVGLHFTLVQTSSAFLYFNF